MTAGQHDFPVEQDVTFRQRVTWSTRVGGDLVPYDLTGCTARMQIRAGYDVVPEFITLTTENGGLTVGTGGVISIYMTPTQTNSITVKKARYDLVVVFPSGDVKRVLAGRLLVEPNITELT